MKNTKKFADWDFTVDDKKLTQQIRVATSGTLELSTTLSDGSVLTGTDVTQFRRDIHARLRALHELVWVKKIVVAVKGTKPDVLGRSNRERASLDLVWGIRYMAKGPKIDLWRERPDDKRSESWHHIDTGCTGDDCVRVLPWSQRTEDFLCSANKVCHTCGREL